MKIEQVFTEGGDRKCRQEVRRNRRTPNSLKLLIPYSLHWLDSLHWLPAAGGGAGGVKGILANFSLFSAFSIFRSQPTVKLPQTDDSWFGARPKERQFTVAWLLGRDPEDVELKKI